MAEYGVLYEGEGVFHSMSFPSFADYLIWHRENAKEFRICAIGLDSEKAKDLAATLNKDSK